MTPPRLRLLLLAFLLAALPHPGRATVNLTGSWIVEVFGSLVPVTITQSGTSLTYGTEDGDPYTGTIDSASGAFSLVGTPYPGGILAVPMGSLPYGPSPAPSGHGMVSADGNTFDAIFVEYFIKLTPPINSSIFPWFGIDLPARGARSALVVCGDGDVDLGETCDDGPANGTDGCCSATCHLIDADFDGVCDGHDDCPAVYDPAQTDPCHPAGSLRLSQARIRLRNGHVHLRGTMDARTVAAGIAAVTVQPTSNAEQAVACVDRPPQRSTCSAGIGGPTLRLTPAPGSLDWRFILDWRPGAGTGPVTGPVSLTLTDPTGARRTDDLPTCVATPSRLTCHE
ncbi:MAG: hypothetical protein U0807_05625 [Candidatus Binatia bacterium]